MFRFKTIFPDQAYFQNRFCFHLSVERFERFRGASKPDQPFKEEGLNLRNIPLLLFRSFLVEAVFE
jgi:hypothetical protein